MPELPDVESFKIYTRETSLRKQIVKVACPDKRVLKKISCSKIKKGLIGRQFIRINRRGKFLIFGVSGTPQKLIFHFGMTGDLHYIPQEAPREGLDRFTRFLIGFQNSHELRWINVRGLGKIYFLSEPKDIPLIREMGPEPFSLSKQEFRKLLKVHQNRIIKAFLLDQRAIAGIGNVYSDEILFQAKIHPKRKIKELSSSEISLLFQKMKEVLREAVRVRPPLGMLFGAGWLLNHRDKDMRCSRNGKHLLKKETIAGRSAVFCPHCQR